MFVATMNTSQIESRTHSIVGANKMEVLNIDTSLATIFCGIYVSTKTLLLYIYTHLALVRIVASCTDRH